MNSNLKMTVERSKRRSYFLSLVFITKCSNNCIDLNLDFGNVGASLTMNKITVALPGGTRKD